MCLRVELDRFLEEFLRGVKALFSRPIENIAFILSTPLWLLFFVLTLRGYGVVRLSTMGVQLFMWIAYAFAVYSTWLWGFGHGIIDEGYDNILEYVVASGESLFTHFLGWGLSFITYELMDLAVIAVSFYAIFGTMPLFKAPALMAASLVMLTVELLSISAVYSMLIIGFRSNWVITNVIQFILPVIGGLMPSELSKYVGLINRYSPIAYPLVLLRESALGVNELSIPLHVQVEYSLITLIVLLTASYAVVEITTRRLRINGKLGLA